MNSIRCDRLLRLADHLCTGPLGHGRFWYGFYNAGNHDERYRETPRLKNCGTSGCAAGECPFVFEEWSFDRYDQPSYQGLGTYRSCETFFGLTGHQVEHLFFPQRQLTDRYGGQSLASGATAEQVGHHIGLFCARVVQLLNT